MRLGLVVKKGGTVRAGPSLNLVKKGGLTRDDKVNREVVALVSALRLVYVIKYGSWNLF